LAVYGAGTGVVALAAAGDGAGDVAFTVYEAGAGAVVLAAAGAFGVV
jgi:hypothetical protein